MITSLRFLFGASVVFAIFQSTAAPLPAHTDPLAVSVAPTFNPTDVFGRSFTCKPASKRFAASTAPSTNPTNAPGGSFTYNPAAVSFSWPAGWSKAPTSDYVCVIVPDDEKTGIRWIALDVPQLPIHIPGLIPMNRVEAGYLDDVKRQFGQIDVKELTPPALPNAKVRLVRAGWHKDGKSMEQIALLIVHADHVYIFRGRSDTDHEQPTTDAFNSMISTIKWTK